MLDSDDIPPALLGALAYALLNALRSILSGSNRTGDKVQEELLIQLREDNAILERQVERLSREVVQIKHTLKRIQQNKNLIWLEEGGHDS